MTAIGTQELIFWSTGRNRKYIEVYKFDTKRSERTHTCTCDRGRAIPDNYVHNAVHSLQGVPLNTLHLKMRSRLAGDVAQYHLTAVLKYICQTCPENVGVLLKVCWDQVRMKLSTRFQKNYGGVEAAINCSKSSV